ncbi:MAG TPA: protein phosphatase 2C domain-containing protein [Myxococcota bacterium]|nr:protein phosphatase 2C domain-containing protein [Myxococcota bacterium]
MASSLPYTEATALSRTGSRKTRNADRFGLWDPREELVLKARRGSIYAVADGVSSAVDSDRAAETAIECMREFFTSDRRAGEDLILDLVERADAEVRLTTGSACTLAGVWLHAAVATVFNIGDSAVFLWRSGTIERLTPAQRRGGGLAAYIGMGGAIRPSIHVQALPFRRGDVFLVGSDGIFDAVPPGDLRVLCEAPAALLPTVATRLVDGGHDDDATLVYVRVLEIEASASQAREMRDA